jgi:hypothetical protein
MLPRRQLQGFVRLRPPTIARSLINYKPIAILHTILNSFAPPLPSNEETASANIIQCGDYIFVLP